MKNKNITLAITVFALLLATVSLNLNAQKFEKGDKDLNLSIGFGHLFLNSYYHASLPTIAISGDYGLRDDWGPGVFGVGAYFSATTYKYKYAYLASDYGWKYTYINIAARATYHYQFVKKLDTYAGVLLGLQIRRAKTYGDWGGYHGTSEAGVGAMGAVFAGAKYYLTKNFAGMCEIYLGNTAIFNIGIALKF